MEEQLEQKHLTTLTLPTAQLYWTKAGKELIFDGRYFDVKKIVSQNPSSTVVSGIYDQKETSLQHHINQVLNHKKNTDEKRTAQWCFSIAVLPAPALPKLQHRALIWAPLYSCCANSKLPATLFKVPTPPPVV